MRRKLTKRLVLFLDIAGVLTHELPERFDTAEFADIMKNFVAVLIRARRQHSNDNILCRATV